MESSEWTTTLPDHTIFKQDEHSDSLTVSLLESRSSISKLPAPPLSWGVGISNGYHTSRTTRKALMCIRGSDLIIAVENRIRMTSLVSLKVAGGTDGTYKTLNTPKIRFNILQLSLNPNGRLLAVGGSYQIAVIVVPRAGYAALTADAPECILVGQLYHATPKSPGLAKIAWHPLAEGDASLIVLTEDGVLREYFVPRGLDEPQQTLSCFCPRHSTSLVAATRAVSFCFGHGRDDWGSLTIFVLDSDGDVWSICPFMPTIAMIPASLLRLLSSVASKNLLRISSNAPAASSKEIEKLTLETRYQQQMKFMNGLLAQLTGGLDESEQSTMAFEKPKSPKLPAAVQGPYRFVPAPLELDGSPGVQATDIMYIESEGTTPSLSVLAVVYGDGKVDIALDLEKVDGRWQARAPGLTEDLPELITYETIDLGIVSKLSGSLPKSRQSTLRDRLQQIHPVLVADPLYNDTFYVYHDFGVHCLVICKWLEYIQAALLQDDQQLSDSIKAGQATEVAQVVDCPLKAAEFQDPVTGVGIVHGAYLSYGLVAVTASMRVTAAELAMRTAREKLPVSGDVVLISPSQKKASSYICSLQAQPFLLPDVLVRPNNVPSVLRPPASAEGGSLTPEGLQFLGGRVDELREQMQELAGAGSVVQKRLELQGQEMWRQLAKLVELQRRARELGESGQQLTKQRFAQAMEKQKSLLRRLDRVLQLLMDNHDSALSEPEKEWLTEMQRMKMDLNSSPNGMMARIDMLQFHVANLEPQLQLIALQERASLEVSRNTVDTMGSSQKALVERRLETQYERLHDAREKVNALEASLRERLSIGAGTR